VDHAGERAGGGRLVHDGRVELVDIVAQARGGGRERTTVERVGRQVSGDELGGVHVPALVDAAFEVAPDEARVQLPRHGDVVGVADREDVGRAVGHVHTGACDGELHDVLGVVRRRMLHRLVGGGDAEGRRVVVGPIVQRADAALAGVDELGNGCAAIGAEDRLRCFDLHFEADASGRQSVRTFEGARDRDHRLHLVDGCHLGEGEGEAVGEAAGVDESADEHVEGAQSACTGAWFEALEAGADERCRGARVERAAQCGDRLCDIGVLGRVVEGAVAVLEVDAEVFDRLGGQLVLDECCESLRFAVGSATCTDECGHGVQSARVLRGC
jgi:hypothetical protein